MLRNYCVIGHVEGDPKPIAFSFAIDGGLGEAWEKFKEMVVEEYASIGEEAAADNVCHDYTLESDTPVRISATWAG